MAKYVVRYGAMRVLGVFSAHSSAVYCRDARVIVRTERGLEAAVVLGEATEAARAALKDPTEGQILRTMTAEDEHELLRIAEQARRELDVCQTYVDRLGLEMSLVELERIFGGERVVVYYLAENRVDFRELVRLLAAEFQTRIEMRQIGVRDEAKLLADYGDCGKPTCCNSHLVQMPPVSMRMAKMQKATLDPTKISGRCGRLKCCLRYEFEMYEQQELPLVQLDDGQLVRPAVPDRSRRLGAVSRPCMLDPAIAKLLEEDRRYPLEAYIFVFEALHYAQNVLGMGSDSRERARRRRAGGGRARAATARDRPGTVPGHPPVRPGAIRLHGQARAGQLGPARDGRFRRDRLQPDPHRPDAEDAARPPRGFRQRLRFRLRLPRAVPHRDAGNGMSSYVPARFTPDV